VDAEIVWALPLLAPRPSSSALVGALRRETELDSATLMIEREARRLTESALALVVMFEWTQRIAWTPRGYALTPEVVNLIADVAGSGRRAISNHTIVEPIGGAPTRAVLVMRRDGKAYSDHDYETIRVLAKSVSEAVDRLIPR
jgi:hypothetical protein